MKTLIDNAVIDYFTTSKLFESHSIDSRRLFYGYAAALTAGFTLYFDWTYKLQRINYFIAGFVVCFTILHTVYTYLIWKLEGNNIFIGKLDGLRVRHLFLFTEDMRRTKHLHFLLDLGVV